MKNTTLLILIFMILSCKNEIKTTNNESDTTIETPIVKDLRPLKIIEPVKWLTEVKKLTETEYELLITAHIENGYHLYSQTVPETGPQPTVFIFQEHDSYELVGPTIEEQGPSIYDSVFKLDIKSFKTKTTFKQKIKLKKPVTKTIVAEIEYMSCNNTNCLMGYTDIKFEI